MLEGVVKKLQSGYLKPPAKENAKTTHIKRKGVKVHLALFYTVRLIKYSRERFIYRQTVVGERLSRGKHQGKVKIKKAICQTARCSQLPSIQSLLHAIEGIYKARNVIDEHVGFANVLGSRP